MNACRPILLPGESAEPSVRQLPALAIRKLPDAVVITRWNSIAKAGGMLQETLIRFARLIEAEVSR